jgi:hypothetical protein
VVSLAARSDRAIATAEAAPPWLSVELLEAAREIYETYCESQAELSKYPLGVALDRQHFRGKVIFRDPPILLPGEVYVTLEHLESFLY